jgi:ferric-dicitrate binding protein FerR (iron transport regulator)
MQKYINKVIALCTQPDGGMPAPLRDAFHQWLTDEEHAPAKEAALLDLWQHTDGASTEETLASLASWKLKRQFAPKPATLRLAAWKYAAALIVLLAGAYVFMHRTPPDIIFTEHFTGYGESDTLTLPDGSRVQTNSGTLLVYPADFGAGARTLYLSGEACFKVAKNTAAPFTVQSKYMAVTALGTEFNVAGYANDRTVKATLLSGSIRVTVAGNSTDFILEAGEQLVYDKQQAHYTINRVNLHDATAWQRGELVFRGASLPDILTALERKYAVSFQYNTAALNDDKFNFHFQPASTLEEVMEIITTVAGAFEYTIINLIP